MESIVLKNPSVNHSYITLQPTPSVKGFWNMRITRYSHGMIAHRTTEACSTIEKAQDWMENAIQQYQAIGYVMEDKEHHANL